MLCGGITSQWLGVKHFGDSLVGSEMTISSCAEIEPCEENMVNELPASHLKGNDILPTLISVF